VRITALQRKRHWEKSRRLAYAAEAEFGARRAVRETIFPKTVGLASREPQKAELLVALKLKYDATYQRLRYLTKRVSRKAVAAEGVTLARLRMSWILREAWTILASQPPPIIGKGAIPI
jgi:hypothetical protein